MLGTRPITIKGKGSFYIAQYPVRWTNPSQVDALGRGMEAVLMQARNPIAFASLSRSDCETRYANIERDRERERERTSERERERDCERDARCCLSCGSDSILTSTGLDFRSNLIS